MAKNSFVALFHHLFFTVMSDQSVEASRIRPLYECLGDEYYKPRSLSSLKPARS
ncbi:hypothetical protein PCANC_04814 [Puccinia coronata f. sp. avenae]|uniref:Uncharacterized protein n=1 Tax=Puccinia coronata f. sp. avenae TaxID=200324 RepID=A0A2N5W2R5_9BASI|nr:hypothetical protein PCANC_04814 [Puccinia coronata f. sp. avenae]